MMKTTLMALLSLVVTAGAQTADLRNLSKAQYTELNKTLFEDFKKDPQPVGRQAKQVLIGMLGLEDRVWAHTVFDVDVVFNVNSMLLLVANANKIKRGKTFIEEYQKEVKTTAKSLHDEKLVMFLETFSSLLIRENEKLAK